MSAPSRKDSTEYRGISLANYGDESGALRKMKSAARTSHHPHTVHRAWIKLSRWRCLLPDILLLLRCSW